MRSLFTALAPRRVTLTSPDEIRAVDTRLAAIQKAINEDAADRAALRQQITTLECDLMLTRIEAKLDQVLERLGRGVK